MYYFLFMYHDVTKYIFYRHSASKVLKNLILRGSFSMFVESGCISTNLEITIYKYIYFESSSFFLSTDMNFTSVALSSVKIYSFE